MLASREKLQVTTTLNKLFLLFQLYLLSKVILSSANKRVRKKVRNRAKNKCEGCEEIPGYKLIVAHMNHTHDEHYNNIDRLKAYCIVCEFAHHVSHIGKAKEIGLIERNNFSTSNGLWREVLRSHKNEVPQLYKKYKSQIDKLHEKFDYNISDFGIFW
jgi:hypothetical protein